MTPRLEITGLIGEDNATTAFVGAFLDQNPGPVLVNINSPGGLATEGAAIMAALQRHGQVTVQVDGLAASAASLAMIGGRRIILHPAALVMIHEPSALVFGPADAMRQTADALDKISGVYADAYARATGNPVARVAGWMKVETWMTAEEAVALNFGDEIGGDTAPVMVARFDYTRFMAAPAQLVRAAHLNGWATASPVSSDEENHA